MVTDLRHELLPATAEPNPRRRQAAQLARRLALLHAHGLIVKVSHPHCWQVITQGRRQITAWLAARAAGTGKLLSLAA